MSKITNATTIAKPQATMHNGRRVAQLVREGCTRALVTYEVDETLPVFGIPQLNHHRFQIVGHPDDLQIELDGILAEFGERFTLIHAVALGRRLG